MKTPTELKVPLGGGAVTALVYDEAPRDVGTLVLAHGAGAGQRSPFMVAFARGLSSLGVGVITFDFPYIEAGRRLPDRRPVLEACYRAVVAEIARVAVGGNGLLLIGGKSMGGRIATHVAAADSALPIDGLVLLGYPLHPPGRPDERRDAHLASLVRPVLFVQGSRDAFGTPAELQPIVEALAPRATLHVVAGGDHSFKIARGAPAAREAFHSDVQRAIAGWIATLTPRAR